MAVSRPAAQPLLVRATCQTGDDVGKCVYETAEPVSGVYRVTTVDPGDWAKMPAVAVIVGKSSSTDCQIQFFGEIRDVYSGLGVGRAMFVGDDGSLTETPPVPPPGGSVFVQPMGSTLGSAVILLNPSFSLVRRIG
jgi:hypothetical protein